MGIFGFYFSVAMLIKFWPSKAKVAAAPVVVSHSTGGEIPSADSPEFTEWISADGNLEKLLNSLV